MKVVINKCFGGFSLSPAAVARLAELEGRECHAFKQDLSKGFHNTTHIPVPLDCNEMMVVCFDVPNPDDFSEKELWDKHHLTNRPSDRTCENLVKVVEELGDDANGQCAKLRIVEIPWGVNFEINEYDGMESIHEVHRSWG